MAVQIGFDNMEIPEEIRGEEKVSKKGKRQLVDKTKSVFISEKKLKEIEEEYETVVVHEFGDDYHLTEEEKEEKNQYYKAFSKLNKSKHKYRRLDEYIRVMRLALHCLNLVAENNMIYDPEDFKVKCLQGKIKVSGLFFPEYKGKDRKSLSWKYISEFILSEQDPSELMKQKEEVFSESEMEDLSHKLFDQKELDQIIEFSENREKESHDNLIRLIKDDEKHSEVVDVMSKKEVREMMKTHPELVMAIRDVKKDMRSAEIIKDTFASDLTYDDLEKIRQYDQKHNYAGLSVTEMPKFKGCMLDDKDFDRYMYQLQNYAEETIREDYHGKMKTLAEIRELEVKSLLEENNWNIRNLYNNRELEEKRKQMKKEGEKKERKIKKRLLKIQKRNRKRSKRLMGEDLTTKKKKKKKKRRV